MKKITLNKKRVEDYSHTINLSEHEKLIYDFSKTHITESEMNEFRHTLASRGLSDRIEAMHRGDPINFTENRPVLHYLLRSPRVLESVCSRTSHGTDSNCPDSLKKESDEIIKELQKVKQFCTEFESARGVTGRPLRTIVNIGIGGSDLGPKMVTRAFPAAQFAGRKAYFISNVDATGAIEVFEQIDPEETLFVVVSKTFTTAETLANFKLATSLFMKKTGLTDEREISSKHFVAVSSNLTEVEKYGITRTFAMWDYVGGRYSLWSPVGLSIALYLGFEHYLEMLTGASIVDEEFFQKKDKSLPARLAILESFYAQEGFTNKCIAAYDVKLEMLYKYLQQAEMESNGKAGSSQMIIWGGVGTDVQHSFFQQLHQGDSKIFVEFVLPVNKKYVCVKEGKQSSCTDSTSNNLEKQLEEHQKVLIANCLAQSRALLIGRDSDDKAKIFTGNRPSITVLLSELTPKTLGALLAIYEHKIFVSGVLYGINSFDQFGVQLGKDIAKELREEMDGNGDGLDESTEMLLKSIKKMWK